jgi:hypothetical protein
MRTSLCAFALLTALVLVSCASVSASPSARPQASEDVPSLSASASAPEPSATTAPSAAPTPAPIAGQLPVPGFVTVHADDLLIREEPGLDGKPLVDRSACIDNPNPCERPFTLGTTYGYLWAYLFDGPITADGYDWYLAATEMNTEHHASIWPNAVGWVAAGDGEDAWLVADQRSCPQEPIELAEVTNLALTKLEMLHCLGDKELTLRGWLPAQGADEDPDASLAECRTNFPWLMCAPLLDIVRTVERGWAGNADYLDFVIDPSSDVVVPERGQWVTLTGAFDHPDADTCGDVAEVLICRFSFVISAIQPGGPGQ